MPVARQRDHHVQKLDLEVASRLPRRRDSLHNVFPARQNPARPPGHIHPDPGLLDEQRSQLSQVGQDAQLAVGSLK